MRIQDVSDIDISIRTAALTMHDTKGGGARAEKGFIMRCDWGQSTLKTVQEIDPLKGWFRSHVRYIDRSWTLKQSLPR